MAAIVIAFVALYIPLNTRKTELETQLADLGVEKERITQENELLMQQLNEKMEQAKALEADLETRVGEIGTLTADKAMLQTSLEEANTQNTALQASLEEKSAENASLTTELEKVNAALETENARLEAMQADLDAFAAKSLLDESKIKVLTSAIEDLEQKQPEQTLTVAAAGNGTDDDGAPLVWSDGKNELCRHLTAQLKRNGFEYECSWSDEFNCDLVRLKFYSVECDREVVYNCWVREDSVCIKTENLPLLVKDLEKEEILKCHELNINSPVTRFTVEDGRLVATFQFLMSVGKKCGEDMLDSLFSMYWDIEEAWKSMRTYERTHP